MNREIDDLEREIADTRADLDDALDMLQSKMTLSSLVDNAFGHMHHNPSAVSSSMGHMFAHRPFTGLLLSAGLNWYTSRRAERKALEHDREWQAYNPEPKHRVRDLAARARKRAKAGAERVSARVSDVVDHVEETASQANVKAHKIGEAAGERLHEMKDKAGERLHKLADGTRRRMHDTRELGSERMHGLKDKTQGAMRKNKNRATGFFERQPLLAGALLAIAGAAIASVLPKSAPERKALRSLAPKAKRLKKKVTTAVVHGVEQGATMATSALETATTKIEEAIAPDRSIH